MSRLFFSIPSPSNLPILVFLPFSRTIECPSLPRRLSGWSAPGHAVPVAPAPREREDELAVRAEGARGRARRLRRGSETSAPSAPSPPPPRQRSEGSVPATPSPSLLRRGSEESALRSRRPRRRRAAGVLPFPRPLLNAVTPVVVQPLIVINNQLGRGTG